ncbi:hypothetical protein OEZ86_000021 [Tetradesmus obliquus]|nr:hypothetical protein OEZ86_000021 [Tetradesmus obliquus]
MLQAVRPLNAQQRQQQQDDDGPIEISSDDSSDEDEQQHGPIPQLQTSGAAAALAVSAPEPRSADAAAAYIAALAGAVPVSVQHPQPSSLGSGQATSWAAVQARLGGLARPAVVGRRSRGSATTTLLRKDFGLLLLPTEWLNDELVNYYLLLLQLRSDAILQLQARLRAALQQLGARPSSLPHQLRVLLRVPRSYAFSSFFYTQLAPGQGRFCYQAVQRWTRPQATHTSECVLAYQLLLFPINLGNTHWAVAAVWPQAGLLQYFDPLPGRREGRRVLASLARWLLQDAADKGVALPCRRARQLRLEHAPQGMLVQCDGHSCGVFAAAVCERLAAGWHAPFEFSQDDCPSLRLGLAADMLAGAVGW